MRDSGGAAPQEPLRWFAMIQMLGCAQSGRGRFDDLAVVVYFPAQIVAGLPDTRCPSRACMPLR